MARGHAPRIPVAQGHALRSALLLCALAVRALGADITYQVTLNPEVCHEVHVGKFTSQPYPAPEDLVNTGAFRYEIRSEGKSVLLIAAAYESAYYGVAPSRLAPAPEKYAVDLNRPKTYRRISDSEWEAALLLPYDRGPRVLPRDGDPGVQFGGGPLLRSSSPNWRGAGNSSFPIEARFSRNRTRAAVNSWDGIVENPGPWPGWVGSKIHGRYYVDIYDGASSAPLVRIRGTFKRVDPYLFQGHGDWYSGYYVIPMGRTLLGSLVGMDRLLVCDADAAARKVEELKQDK